MPHYKIVNETNPDRHVVASLALRIASAELHLSQPGFNFIQPTIKSIADFTLGECVFGLARRSDKQVFFRSGLDHKNLADTAFHECRHVWQFQHGGFNRECRERDARIYALELMVKLGDPAEFQILETLMKIANEKGL